MPPPIAADLRPCADGSAVRTALVAWPRRCAPSWPRWDRQTDRQSDGRSDGRIAALPNAPCGLRRGHNNQLNLFETDEQCNMVKLQHRQYKGLRSAESYVIFSLIHDELFYHLQTLLKISPTFVAF